MALGPYREAIDFDLFTRLQRDGTPELVAFFKTPINGWCPMIAVWRDDKDPAVSQEDTLTVLGEHIAYCISDEKADQWDDLVPANVQLIDPRLIFAIGSLTRRVI